MNKWHSVMKVIRALFRNVRYVEQVDRCRELKERKKPYDAYGFDPSFNGLKEPPESLVDVPYNDATVGTPRKIKRGCLKTKTKFQAKDVSEKLEEQKTKPVAKPPQVDGEMKVKFKELSDKCQKPSDVKKALIKHLTNALVDQSE